MPWKSVYEGPQSPKFHTFFELMGTFRAGTFGTFGDLAPPLRFKIWFLIEVINEELSVFKNYVFDISYVI